MSNKFQIIKPELHSDVNTPNHRRTCRMCSFWAARWLRSSPETTDANVCASLLSMSFGYMIHELLKVKIPTIVAYISPIALGHAALIECTDLDSYSDDEGKTWKPMTNVIPHINDVPITTHLQQEIDMKFLRSVYGMLLKEEAGRYKIAMESKMGKQLLAYTNKILNVDDLPFIIPASPP